MNIVNLTGYKFVPNGALGDVVGLRARLLASARALRLKGTLLLAPEGVNVSIAGEHTNTAAFARELRSIAALAGMRLKESFSECAPFDRLLVKVKRELAPCGAPVAVAQSSAARVTPRELKRWLDDEKDVVLLDARNAFEVALGTFANATHFGLKNFREFARNAQTLAPALQHRTVVTFCTGGIRCEKAALLLAALGVGKVFQLDGGILEYFADCGGAHFDGACFVFDQRGALNTRLQAVDNVPG